MKTFKHLFTALLLLCCITVGAHDFEVDGIYYKITDESNKTVSVTYEGSSYNYQPEYNEYTGDVVLQPTVMYGGNTYNVTGIADNAFEYCANLQSVTIPSSIKSIGYRSFENCLSLQTVNLSEGLTSIGVCAFQYCTKLTAIVIPSSVTTISNYAFRDCPKLESVTFCAQVAPTVATDVFTRISSTAVLKYPAGSDYSSWSGYFARTEEFAATIGGSCGANVNWTFENGVLTITGNGAMDDYTAPWMEYAALITNVVIEDGVTKIGESAFSGCSALTSIVIPNSVTHVGQQAFDRCTALESVTIGSGVKSGFFLAFNGCSKLTSITSLIPAEDIFGITGDPGDSYWGLSDKERCTLYVPYGAKATYAKTAPWNEFANIVEMVDGSCGANVNWTLEGDVLTISGSGNMDDYSSDATPWNKYKWDIKTVIIESGVTSIGNYAFSSCKSLASIEIPNSVTSIGVGAFSLCNSLTNVTMPDGITTIRPLTFADCNSLGNITIPNGVTRVDGGAFLHCTSLAGIEIPASVTAIDKEAFKDCSHLSKVVSWATTAPTLGDGAFANIDPSATLHYPAGSDYSAWRGSFASTKEFTKVSYQVISESDKTAKVIAATKKYTGDVVIPAVIDGYTITGIGEKAFYNCSSLTSIRIPSSVTSIGKWAFCGCGAMTRMTIGNGVASIGDYAFQNCNGLTGELVIPDAVASIGNYAFQNCSSLTGIVIGNSVTSIGTDAFSGCSGLVSMTIGRSVTNIGNYAFNGCTSLKNLRFEDGEGALTLGNSGSFYDSYGMFRDCPLETLYIGRDLSYNNNKDYYSPFYNIKTLTSLTIGNSVTNIGNYAFYGCTGLTGELVIPNSVTSIGYSAFNGCSGLSSLTLGNGLAAIDSSAFYGCIGLTGELVIPNSVTTIGSSAFYNCSGLSSLTLGNGIKTIVSSAFNGCTSLKNLRFEDGEGVIPNTDKLFKDSPLETLYLGRDLSFSNSNSPFYNKTSLKSVTIGDCVTTIASSAFYDCSGLSNLTIGSGVTSIGNNAFYNCSGLSSLTIGSGVTSIGSSAFNGCTSLKDLRIEDGEGVLRFGGGSGSDKGLFTEIPLESLYLGRDIAKTVSENRSPFHKCKTLTNVIISDKVTSIGVEAFYNCSGIKSIVLPDGVTTIGSSAFSGCTGLTGELVIPNSVETIGSSAFSGCSGLSSLTLGNGFITIGSSAFSGCTGLTGELVIPKNVTSIGSKAFASCKGLTGELLIPNSVTTIGSEAFSGCIGLTGKLVIPNSVTSIGSSAFYNCSGLSSLTLGNGVTTIGSSAFFGCSALKEVHISDIGAWCGIGFSNSNYANPLYWAKNLYLNGEMVTELVIPEGVTEVKAYAFFGYDKLINVTIPSSVTKIGSYAFNSAKAVFDIAAEELSTIGSGAFHSNAVLAVPDAVVDAYKAAWSGYAAQITGKSEAFVSVDVKAMDATSGIMERVGIDKMSSIAKLTVKGSINSYDVIQFRDKMPLLRELDLSEATVVASDKAFYNGNCTKDNDLGGNAFYGLSKLNYVKLPKDLIAVGAHSFYGCSSLREMVVPETVQSIGEYAFYSCTSLKNVELPKEMVSIGDYAFSECSSLGEIIIPIGVKSTGRYVFDGCRSLERITLPNGLESIDYAAFRGCTALNEIKMPPTVQFLGGQAFYNCSSLEEIRIPSSVTSIGSSAFAGCSKLAKVYAYTVEPTAIQENTFSTFQTATLYVPSFSFSNYYWDDGWKRFLNLAEFNEPYEYFYVNNDYVLNDDTGYIEGTEGNNPDADINAGGGFIVEGELGDDETPNQSLGDVNVGSDGEGTSGSIIGDNNLHIDDLHIKINVKGGRWYFFAFPFDIFFEDITMENGSDYVFRFYDGAERAQNGKGGWKDINENHLKAARGYIFQCSANDVLVLNIEDVKFKKEDKYNELVAHVSDNLKDASWNFTGNPYLSYYDMADMDYTAPVTVWDGSKYVAIRPGDDDYHFAPYEAFFVQKPEGQEAIGFDGEEQMTKNQSNKQKEKQAAARRARGIDPERLLINLVLGNGTSEDRTRIVFNERQSLAYETACDATKFETAGVAQIYTIGGDNVHYAINERPADNGRVVLGYTAPIAGFYTIEAQRMDVEVYVKDFKTGTLHNLKDGAYSFGTDAGTFNDRFEILLKGTAPGTTGIDELKGENGNVKTENGEVKTEIYDLQGRKMQDAGKGIYIINGEKVMK